MMRVKLKELGDIITGNTPSKKTAEYWDSDDICFVKPDIIDETGVCVINDSTEHISHAARSKARIVGENALFVTCIGSIGKIGIAGPGEYAFNQQINAIIPNNNVNSKYLAYAILYNKSQLVAIANAPVVPIINKSQFSEFELNVEGDYSRQLEVVAVLDRVRSVMDSREEELNKLDELIKARFVEMFGDAVDNPMKWPTKELQDLVTDDCTISYGIVQTGDDQEDGVPVFRPVDIVNRVPIKSELKKTSEEISNKYKRTILKGRELLITVRANIADTCIVGSEFAGCNVGRGIVPIRTNEEEMLLEFLKHQIDSKHLNDDIKAMAKGITLIQLNIEDLRTVKLMVPPIKQQKVFMEFANQVDKSKVVVQKALVEAQLLFDSLIQKYFG